MSGLDLRTNAIEELRVAFASEDNRVASLLPWDRSSVGLDTDMRPLEVPYYGRTARSLKMCGVVRYKGSRQFHGGCALPCFSGPKFLRISRDWKELRSRYTWQCKFFDFKIDYSTSSTTTVLLCVCDFDTVSTESTRSQTPILLSAWHCRYSGYLFPKVDINWTVSSVAQLALLVHDFDTLSSVAAFPDNQHCFYRTPVRVLFHFLYLYWRD
jgi:hypothetical protein